MLNGSGVPFNLRFWAILPLLVVVCGCSTGGGCAGPKRRDRDVDRLPAAVARVPPTAVSPRAGEATKAAPRLPRQAEDEGTVIRVRDGDSIVVLRGGVGVEVRLDGIDCPELAQAFGKKAKGFTSGLALGRQVRLVGAGKDRYDRELAEVFLPDGRSLNRELVSAGLAWWFRKYSTDRGLEILEQEARIARRGLWARPAPVAPWDFRERRRILPGLP